MIERVDPHDHGNLDTRLDPCRRPEPNRPTAGLRSPRCPEVERIAKHDGRISLRVHGIEFARDRRRRVALRPGANAARARPHHMPEIERLVGGTGSGRARTDAASAVPAVPRSLAGIAGARRKSKPSTPRCCRDPIYGQVPAFAGGDRGILDLLAVDRTGRLVVIELKASADLHLPLQALDYWIRVKWHLDRGEFSASRLLSGHRVAARARRGSCWSRRHSIFIQLRRPFWVFSHPTSMWSESG